MKAILIPVSLIALVWIVVAAVLYYASILGRDAMLTQMLIATCLWFIVTPFWVGGSVDSSGPDESSAEA